MGGATGSWGNDTTPGRPPNAQPQPGAQTGADGECVNCIKKCKKRKLGVTEYGCWCGGDVAPAVDKKVEHLIPPKRSQYDAFLKEQGLPQPYDGVDRCCMVHDLDLGRARQANPNAGFSSGSMSVAGINARLAACFAAQSMNPFNDPFARSFAQRGAVFFTGLTGWNAGGAGLGALSSTLSGSSAGAGAAGAATGAGASGGW